LKSKSEDGGKTPGGSNVSKEENEKGASSGLKRDNSLGVDTMQSSESAGGERGD